MVRRRGNPGLKADKIRSCCREPVSTHLLGLLDQPTLASNSKLLKSNELQNPEEASASGIITGLGLNNYSGITRQSLATAGFAARLV
jgi:hypothetical protein